jgi:DNA helicase-2/ATP-dependent DNA helicase PcrA
MVYNRFMNQDLFNSAYKKLNKAQKEAVDTIDGPVMVVAGPGTGKTQVLSLRIANILVKTDTNPDGILCLTFTNSGVRAMRERLLSYIGPTATQIKISTFHSFAMNILEEFHLVLDMQKPPVILDETSNIALVDEILENGSWQYIRPRGNSGMFFRDIKSLISLLKRENIKPEEFLASINFEIDRIKNDPDSISSRGESKGQLKKEVEKKIDGLARTKEVVIFYEEYEKLKKERGLCDYDDVLKYALNILVNSEDAQATIRERYLYALVDEHQDSSATQNAILRAIWHDTELPNIFVVGDDRQLIYGFGGASIEYFQDFKTLFGKAKLITLVENYRSTQAILDSADTLLQSTMTLEKLKSNHPEMHKLELLECEYPRDEIIACAMEIEKKIAEGVSPDDCAILVPKNYQVKNAVQVLRDRGIPVASSGILTLFSVPEADTLIRALRIVLDPYDNISISESLFDPINKIPPLSAHKFLQSVNTYKLSVEDLGGGKKDLFSDIDPVNSWGDKLKSYIEESNTRDVYELVQHVGESLLLDNAENHDDLIRRVEVVRTVLHLALAEREKSEREHQKFTLKRFIDFIDRLKSYGEDLPLDVFYGDKGVKVLTLHSSKGLEFDFVWVAHMDEKTLMHGKKQAFSLPEDVQNKIEEKDAEVVKKQLYVALTRAKRFCTFSYARYSYTGGDQELSHIIAELPEELFIKKNFSQVEEEILSKDPKSYVTAVPSVDVDFSITDLTSMVAEEYQKTKVSVTMLNNFFECPWKWYFRNLLRLPDVVSESIVFGNVVHGTIEQVLKKNEDKLEDIILAQIHKQNIYEESAVKRLQNEAVGIVSVWVKERLPNIHKSYMTERPLSYRDSRFPNLLFYGKIDLTEEIDKNTFRVTDFKTGSVKTKSEIEKRGDGESMSSYMRQLAMYSYLIHGANNNDRVSESQLEFLEVKKGDKNGIYKTSITNEEIDLLVKDITEYDRELKNGEWVNRPCNFKPYGRDSVCPNCARARIYKK